MLAITFSSCALSASAFRGSDNWGMVNAGWPGYVCMKEEKGLIVIIFTLPVDSISHNVCGRTLHIPPFCQAILASVSPRTSTWS